MENKKFVVLAIDDNKDNLVILKALIKEAFPTFEVLTASGGPQGLALAEQEDPDVILLDVVMPDMDGFEVCARLKADTRLRDIPVVFVTATKGDKENRIKALESGAEAFLAKPVDESELTAQIRAMLKIRDANVHKRDEKQLLDALVEEKTAALQDLHDKLQQSYDELNKEQALIKAIFDGIPGFLYVYDENGRLIKWNKKNETMTGYSPEELSHITLDKWFDPKDMPRVNAAVRDVFEKGYGEVEAPLFLKSGEQMLTRFSGVPLVWDGQKCLTGIGLDVTEQRRAEQAAKTSGEQFYSLFEHMPSGVAIYRVLNDGASGKDYIVQVFNRTALQIEKKELGKVVGKSLFDLRPNIDEYGLIPVFQKVWKTGESAYFPSKVYIDEHFNNWYENRVFKLSTGDIVAIYTDVTENARIREELEESERKYRQIAENISDVVWTTDLNLNTTYISPSLEKMLGESVEAQMVRSLDEKFLPDSLQKIQAVLSEELEKEKDPASDKNRSRVIEVQHYKADKSVIWISMHVSFLRDESGKAVGFLGVSRDISERKMAEHQIKLSEERFQLLFNKAPLGYQSLDFDGCFIDVNQKWLDTLGYEKEEVVGKWFGDFLCPEYVDGFRQRFPIFKAQGFIHSEFEMLTKDKRRVFIAFDGKIGYSADGEFKQTHCILQDITDQRKAEKALIASEAKHRTVIETTQDGFWILNSKGQIVDVNEAYCRMVGYTKTELLWLNVSDLDVVETPQETDAHITHIIKDGSDLFETRHKKKDGSLLDVEVSVTYLDSDNVFVFCRDITGRKKAEKALRESEERFRVAQEISPDGFTILHPVRDETGEIIDFRFIYENLAVARINQTDPEKVIGKRLLDLFPAHRGTAIFEVYKHVANTGKSKVIEEVNVGIIVARPIWLRLVVVSMGEEIAIHSQDITERKSMQNALEESEKKYASYIQNAPDGIFVVDEKGRYVDANPAATIMTGYSREELLKMSIKDIAAPDCLHSALRMFKTLTETGSGFGELRYIHKEGSVRWWNIHATRLSENRYLGFSSDITYKKEAEASLVYFGYHDHLTGIYNRRFFEEEFTRLDTEKNLPISVVMCDINGLKLVNDSFGHQAGDAFLKISAAVIIKGCRAKDVVARIGGDEFAMILPKTDADAAIAIAERIRAAAQREKIHNVAVSLSYGSDTKTSAEQSLIVTLANAENRMYTHKLYARSSRQSKTIDLIMNALFEKSNREAIHSDRVSEVCRAIASKMGLDESIVNRLRTAGLVHDIGKIGIDEYILNKPGSLSDDERKEIERHPEAGWRILNATNEFSELAQSVLYHHERWDGSGYPQGLKGEEIPMEARIIAVADAYDAMTGDRSYKEKISPKEAMEELRRCAGTQFDAAVVNAFADEAWSTHTEY